MKNKLNKLKFGWRYFKEKGAPIVSDFDYLETSRANFGHTK